MTVAQDSTRTRDGDGDGDPQKATSPERGSVAAALDYLARRQDPGGSWKGDYGGPLFLLPMYVATVHILDRVPTGHERDEIVRYIRGQQNRDGGWGLSVESPSHVFTSVLNYTALRLLGEPAGDPDLGRARTWFRQHGGPKGSAQWGKFTLALLDLYDWEGMHPVPPELWLLPYSLPMHPGRLWCHCRMVYMPMSWLYGARATAPRSPIIDELRDELYDEPYDRIDWRSLRERVADTDRYTPHTPLLRAVNATMGAVEDRMPAALRRRALDFVLDQIRREDDNTRYICIGPINKVLNLLCWHFTRPGGEEVRRHLERLPDYLWHADDGLKMQGYNSSELWDTAFAAQAIAASGEAAEHRDMVRRAHDFIDRTQVREDTPEMDKSFRHPSKGGWPFSTRDHGWPITDCTAEGIKAAIALEPLVEEPISRERLTDAVDLLLSFQNPGGGWATYERTRGPAWLEKLNPSDVFGDIMIDYPYVECTSASVQALDAFRRRHPGIRDRAIEEAVARGRDFILSIQRDDGSWYGSWGVCFTYGTWFGVWGLLAAGLGEDDPAVRRACDFLERHQLPDGGWGETLESCRQKRYVHADGGQAVMTSWALLALVKAGRGSSDAVRRGLAFLEGRQQPDGSFPAEVTAGVFNRTSAIHYDNYLKVFPLWAMSLARG
ncbi:MAG: terpene cyclase/mutase family protein [Myxococcota bacterium]